MFLPCQVSTGLYRLLVELCILRHIQSPNGLVWKCKSSHLYLIEHLAKGKGVSRTRKQEVLLWGWCAQVRGIVREDVNITRSAPAVNLPKSKVSFKAMCNLGSVSPVE